MKILYVDQKASMQGPLTLVTEPPLNERILSAFQSSLQHDPFASDYKFRVADGKLQILGPSPSEQMGGRLAEALAQAARTVDELDARNANDQRRRTAERANAISEAARALGLPVK